jgi:SAM-dependent methyltransferase
MGAVEGNRRAWDIANRKYVEETTAFLAAADEGTLLEVERALLGRLLHQSVVLHIQSGNGTDDAGLQRLGASVVVGIDFSAVATASSQQRADALDLPIRYAVGAAQRLPIRTGSVDLVYTGKGALMWLPDVKCWAAEVARVLHPGAHLFLYEAHPASPLWTSDEDQARVRTDRTYFGGTRTNDSFPASGIEKFDPGSGHAAVEWQWTLADVVTAVVEAGLVVAHLGEYPEPFWRPTGCGNVAAWAGNLPNSFSLLAKRPL